VKDREAWCAAVCGVTKIQTWLRDWTTATYCAHVTYIILDINYISIKIFFVQFLCVFLPPLLKIFCFWSLPFLSFIVPIVVWNVPLISLIFLKICPVFPILLFSSTSLHCSFKKIFLFLLLFSGTLHTVVCVFPFFLCLSLLFFPQLFVKPPQTNTLSSCISFSLRWLGHCLLYIVTNLCL